MVWLSGAAFVSILLIVGFKWIVIRGVIEPAFRGDHFGPAPHK